MGGTNLTNSSIRVDRSVSCCGYCFPQPTPPAVKMPGQCLYLTGCRCCSANIFSLSSLIFSMKGCWGRWRHSWSKFYSVHWLNFIVCMANLGLCILGGSLRRTINDHGIFEVCDIWNNITTIVWCGRTIALEQTKPFLAFQSYSKSFTRARSFPLLWCLSWPIDWFPP